MSSDDSGLDFSRRKLLGSMATIGGAAALGGAGSMAFFSDEENFANNQLTAGKLDLKVDWSEHYSDWSDDEGTAGDNVFMSASDVPSGVSTTPVPTPENPMVYVTDSHLQSFMDATRVEAYPDSDDDGHVDYLGGAYDVCVHGADTPEDLDPTATSPDPIEVDGDGTGLRTLNNLSTAPRAAATYDDENDEVLPLVYIQDVKPGDFGELTLSAHLCDNDGYLWLNGELLEDAENSMPEPERKDPGEMDGMASGELAEEIHVSLWYDGKDPADDGQDSDLSVDDPNGNNLKEDAEQYIVQEASLRQFLSVLNVGNGLALTPPDGGAGGQATLGCADVNATIGPETDSDGVDVGDSVDITQPGSGNTLTIEVIDETTDDEQVAISGNFPLATQAAIGDYLGICSVTVNGTNGTATQDYGEGGCVTGTQLLPTEADVGTVQEVEFDLCQLRETDDRDCFIASDTYYLGLAWWLPVDHANEIQTDSVGFDLGFYTEQCRHNDGSGIDNVNG